MNDERVYAEDVNYWRTSQSSADSWMRKVRKELEGISAEILAEAFGREGDRSAFMIQFRIDADVFRIVWPVLPSKTGKDTAAKVQAATMVYHDVKARCVSAKVLGKRNAFFAFMELPDGRTMTEASTAELAAAVPQLLRPRNALPTLPLSNGPVVDGDWE